MKAAGKTARALQQVLTVLATAAAVLLILISAYFLYDDFYTQQAAFVSWDLMQYKPVVDAEDGRLSFRDLLSLNKDTVGWLSIDGTNIDYPLMQGENDLEYVNKDIYGNFSLTGSIYLSSGNKADFSDPYSLIYGHHMDNGAMFGDIDRFLDQDFFASHKEGYILTPEIAFRLKIFALVETDAYEFLIYRSGEKTADDYRKFLDFIRDHAVYRDEIRPEDLTCLVAMSTCAEGETNGRLVLFADMTPAKAPAAAEETKQEENRVSRRARGHGSTEKWGLLNLACLLMTILVLFPLWGIRAKFSRPSLWRRIHETEDKRTDFSRRVRKGLMVEAAAALLSLLVFLLTEDLHSKMTLTDPATPWMLLIFGVSLGADLCFCRWNG